MRLVPLLTVMPHVLRALPAVPPCVLSCLSFLIPYVLPNLTCCILYKSFWLTCSLSYVPLCLMSLMFFVIYMLYVSLYSRTLVTHMPHVPLAFRASCTHLTFCAFFEIHYSWNKYLYTGNTLKWRSALTNNKMHLNCFQRNKSDNYLNSEYFRTYLANFATKTIVFCKITFGQILLQDQ